MDKIKNIHIPVLKDEVVELLAPLGGQSYLDLTAGYGGHSSEILGKVGPNGQATLVDRDINAVNYLDAKFGADNRVQIIHSDFYRASKQLLTEGKKYDMILADLGLSSPHLDNPDRGFSFMQDGPLDMRMDPDSPITAKEILNTYSEENIANILYNYGEITSSRRIARSIVENRPFATTNDLRTVISSGQNASNKMLAIVFQALRIEVNDELNQLSNSLKIWAELLNPDGRLAIITFHSLEDRLVKQFFNDHGNSGYLSDIKILTKKPIIASDDEIVHNPRSRSAKLRVAQRK